MSENSKKFRVFTFAALVFLFLTRWMFYRLTFESDFNTPRFAAESALFLLLYGLSLFRVPQLVSGLCLLLGCAGLGCLYVFTPDGTTQAFLLPMAYFPAFLFFIDQSNVRAQKASAFSKLWAGIIYAYPWLFLGVILYTIINKSFDFSLDMLYCMLLSILICVVYALMLRTPVKPQAKSKKRQRDFSEQRMRTAIALTIAMIPESVFFALLFQQNALAHTLLILWIVNLLLLEAQGHPMVCAFSDWFKKKKLKFLGNT